jgi:hypothetical protein
MYIQAAPLTLFLALLSVFMAVPGCATMLGKPPAPVASPAPTPAQGLERCATDAIKKEASQILGLVASDLASTSFVTSLNELANQEIGKVAGATGLDIVACAAELFVDATDKKASADQAVSTEVGRARDWVKSH